MQMASKKRKGCEKQARWREGEQRESMTPKTKTKQNKQTKYKITAQRQDGNSRSTQVILLPTLVPFFTNHIVWILSSRNSGVHLGVAAVVEVKHMWEFGKSVAHDGTVQP